MTAFLPKVGEAMVENTGQPRPSYRRWMQQVTEAVNTPATPPGPDPEPPTPPISFVINGSGSVTADGSVAGGEFVVRLDNDQDEPGTTKYYGTDSAGNRGFIALSEGLEAGTGIALTDSGYTMLPSVATPDDLPLTGNAGEAVRVTDEAPGVYAWDGAAFTLDSAADGKAGVVLNATLDQLNDVDASAPSDKQLLGWNASASAWQPTTVGTGMTLIATATVAGAAATSLSVSGLNLSTDGIYYLEWALENASGSTANIALTYNADTTATNYYTQFISGNGAVSGARTNSAVTTSMLSGQCVTSRARIVADRQSHPTAIVDSVRGSASAIVMQTFGHYWTGTANVTGLTLTADVASAIAIGSRIKVFRIA